MKLFVYALHIYAYKLTNRYQMKKTLIIATILFGFFYVQSARAEAPRIGRFILKPSARPIITGVFREKKENIIDVLKNKVKGLFGLRFTGIVGSIGDNLLVVKTKEGKEWNVHLTNKTEVKRRFGGASAFLEFAPNDEVAVVGRRQQTASSEPSETDMDAKNIRNLSIQRRKAVFIGDITVVNAGDASFTIETKARGLQTVYKTKDTEVTDKDVKITFESLSVGDRVIVKGELWDRANTKINAEKIMKLSIKPFSTPTVQP